MVKVKGILGQGPEVDITYLGLNQPPVISSVTFSSYFFQLLYVAQAHKLTIVSIA